MMNPTEKLISQTGYEPSLRLENFKFVCFTMQQKKEIIIIKKFETKIVFFKK